MKSTTNTSVDVDLSRRNMFRTVRDSLRSSLFMKARTPWSNASASPLSGDHAALGGSSGFGVSALFFGFLSCFSGCAEVSRRWSPSSQEPRTSTSGRVKLGALKNDLWGRNLDKPLAGVECAFLTRCFKGSDSVLNAFLSAMNERLYKGPD